ncbi:hypothetical protein SASPL_150084 [Salvia splendens]|uniref:Manganese transport protein n=1 Tax=Salvia splendens TaxID=180675 RepID=A0A8X8Z2I9_SALSN|nr:hypothetical protein SASPL_150084 [Salvia splendens]
MASLQQQQGSGGGNSNRVVAVVHTPPAAAGDKEFDQEDQFQQEPGWKNFLKHVGPGFLVSLAYLDPGNLETDLQAGANHGYELLWVILIGLVFALIIQSLAANLGVSTGKHLAEHCKAEYPIFVKLCLWILAELAVIAADIPEVIGTAFALNILFKIPVWVGVLCTGCSTLLLLGLQKYGVRKLELLIAILVFIMAACFFGELSYVKPPAKEVMKGMFVPKLIGQGATGDAIALLGALVMPHNLFLHSALVLSRKIPNSVRGINVRILGTQDEKMDKEFDDKMILSFELPFALIPLLKFSTSATKMGPHKNSIYIIVFSWILGLGIIGINIYYLSTAFVGWLIHNDLPKLGNVFIGILVFPLMAIYVISVIYLMFRKDRVVTFIDPTKSDPISMENGHQGGVEMQNAPYREDLADIPLPN